MVSYSNKKLFWCWHAFSFFVVLALCNDLNAQTFLSWQKQLSEQVFFFFSFRTWSANGHFGYHSELALNIAYRHVQLHIRSVESSHRVVWLGVNPVGALVMENRCGNGLVLLLYPPAACAAVMKNNGFIPEGRGPQVTPPHSSPSCPRQSTVTLLASQQMTGLGRIWPPCT